MNNKDYQQFLPGFERRLRVLEGLSPVSVKHYCRDIERFFLVVTTRLVSTRDVTAVTRKDVEDFLESCFAKGNKNPTRRTKLIALRKFFKYLVSEDVVKEDPTVNIPLPKVRLQLIPNFTKKEILRMFAAIDIATEKGIRDAVILILGVFAGLRIGEIINLNVADVNDDGKTVDIKILETKHGASRMIETLWKVPSVFLRQWMSIRLAQGADKDTPFLIAYRKGGTPRIRRLTAAGVDGLLKKLADVAGVKKSSVYMHMLRATHASDLRYIRGHDIFSIGKQLGHKYVGTTERYICDRDRKSKEYRSLAEYWHEFASVWSEKIEH